MKWFVYVDAEYYASAHVIEADTAEEAARLGRSKASGNTYSRYSDEGYLGDVYEIGGNYAEPACVVTPFSQVTFAGSDNRVKNLIDGGDYYDD